MSAERRGVKTVRHEEVSFSLFFHLFLSEHRVPMKCVGFFPTSGQRCDTELFQTPKAASPLCPRLFCFALGAHRALSGRRRNVCFVRKHCGPALQFQVSTWNPDGLWLARVLLSAPSRRRSREVFVYSSRSKNVGMLTVKVLP